MYKNMTNFMVLVLLLFVVAACGNTNGAKTQSNEELGRLNNQDGMEPANDGQVFENPYNHNYDGDYDGVRPYTNTVRDKLSAHQVSARVTEIANQVPGVVKATAFAQGTDIVVGIDGTNGADLVSLEKQVFQTVKKQEPGYNIFVTSNRDLHTRIRNLFTNMNTVKTSNVTNGIGEIIYDIGRTHSRRD